MDKELKEFWIKCGFNFIQESELNDGYIDSEGWVAPDGEYIGELPTLTLDNLFRYAVPKLVSNEYELSILTDEVYGYIVGIVTAYDRDLITETNSKDLVQALYQALKKVLMEKIDV
jgi:hypothetical protein